MKKILATILALFILSVIAVSCGGSDDSTTAAPGGNVTIRGSGSAT